jgi:uncharacterized lipoprotein YddW (UPF0748 family)
MKKTQLIIFLLSSMLFAQRPQEFRAVKLTNVDSNVLFTDQNIAAAMDYLASINVNVILPVVWNGAYTQYQSAVMDSIFGVRIHPQFAGRDPLERLVIEAHRVGIEVYPWFEYGFAAWYSGSGTATGGHIIQKFPQWAARSSDGKILKKNGFDWMSAVNPDVQRFINLLVKEVITKYDVDGVEFSDRIPALPVEGGYDSVTVALYKAEHAGNAPPMNYQDAAWMRWRADKLNQWYADVRSIIKKKSPSLFVSSSPSIYPWSYQEYLQDCKNWIDNGIADHFIPQLYRYSFSEYKYELMNAIGQVGADKKKLFPGILMNIGTGVNEYVMSADYLMNVMKENRANGVNGEAFFYYEGLRKNNGLLGDTLRKTFYKERALVPERGGNEWRFPAVIVNEDDAGVKKNGDWSVYQMKGFSGAILRTSDTTSGSNGVSLTYRMNVPYPAFYDVYIYRVPNSPWTTKARYSVLGKNDTSVTIIDQSDLTKKGWYRLRTAFIDSGAHDVVQLNRISAEPGTYLTADAVMISINRSLSPDVVTSVQRTVSEEETAPREFRLMQNYPNPFNPSTVISYTIDLQNERSVVSLAVFDVLGKRIATLVNEPQQSGNYTVHFNASTLASGVYFARLTSNGKARSIKLLVQK